MLSCEGMKETASISLSYMEITQVPLGYSLIPKPFARQSGPIHAAARARMASSQKYRNIAHNNKVAFVVDDITSRDPWRVRCLEIRGTAEQAEAPPSRGAAGDELDRAIIRITPRRIISFGIDDQVSEPHQLRVDRRNV